LKVILKVIYNNTITDQTVNYNEIVYLITSALGMFIIWTFAMLCATNLQQVTKHIYMLSVHVSNKPAVMQQFSTFYQCYCS